MRLLVFSIVLIFTIIPISFAQVTLTQTTAANTGPLQTGFAVITPVTGSGEGLSVSETFGEQIGSNVFQASVLGSPLVTLTDVVVNVDPVTGSNTGVALVNPNPVPATISFSVGNQLGATVATRTITLGAHQQVSRFVTELFSGDPNFNQSVNGLLFINSDAAIGVVALAFSGGTFTSLPVAAQLTGVNVVTTANTTTAPITITAPVTTTFNGIGFAPTTINTGFAPVTPNFNGVPVPPTLLPTPTVLPVPTVANPSTTIPITGSTIPLVTSTGVIPTGTTTFTTTPNTVVVTAPTAFAFPQVIVGLGGSGAMLLPQVATGGGWVTQITIANTSTITQTVRLDLFNMVGGPLAASLGPTVPSIAIPPGGVATLTF